MLALLCLLPDILYERTVFMSKVVHELPNPENGGGKLRNVGKLNNHTALQHARPGSSIGTQWKPQIAVFVLLKMYIISYNFNIIVYCVVFMHERLER